MAMAPAPRHPLFRSVALPVVVASGLLLLALTVMLATTTRSLSRMTPLREHLAVMQRLQEQIQTMQYASLGGLAGTAAIDRAGLAGLGRGLDRLAGDPALLGADGPADIRRAAALLDDAERPPAEVLLRAIAVLHEALAGEHHAHTALLDNIQAQARLERDLAGAALVTVPLAAVLVLFLLRRRFLLPLRNLNTLLTRLGERDFSAAEMGEADPVLEPLFANYNRMVGRLAQLEDEHRARAADLEARVRAATRDLLAHNRSLAEAERLAAVGEMAAGLAHELRNPLAGIQMALANLRRELADPDARERLDLVSAELRRVDGLMNGLLDQARLRPEAAAPVALARVVAELLALVRYQAEPGIAFEQDVAAELVCNLPENRLRQALLNLLLNAAQAMAGHGTVRLAGRREGEHLVISVSDTGPGFPDTLLRQGVRPFASERAGGTGLGLASVRRLAHDLGGRLVLENPPGGGARVSLVLPG
ncbi:two-component sensor histidine kinase [Parasulfuritortus cantonensis]|uniref:histidine kinase n=1 Tax=Parasulfuritortus cantonensis TaxID=2528202 RepID=A0A4R1B5X9_9PROT|nr:ATP-binding protein [Parasulfuritortus cantonensis]TCJ13421.1 two-component sensor histidine kinase [Parasulfuritortus cantonensis]